MRAIDGTHKARAEWSAREIKRELDSIEANMIANGEAGDDERDEDGNPVARIWLGTFFGVTPSGKMYAPWACSNVAGCNGCNGTGEQKIQSPRKRLARRRASARFESLTRKRRRRAASLPEGFKFMWNDPRLATIHGSVRDVLAALRRGGHEGEAARFDAALALYEREASSGLHRRLLTRRERERAPRGFGGGPRARGVRS